MKMNVNRHLKYDGMEVETKRRRVFFELGIDEIAKTRKTKLCKIECVAVFANVNVNIHPFYNNA